MWKPLKVHLGTGGGTVCPTFQVFGGNITYDWSVLELVSDRQVQYIVIQVDDGIYDTDRCVDQQVSYLINVLTKIILNIRRCSSKSWHYQPFLAQPPPTYNSTNAVTMKVCLHRQKVKSVFLPAWKRAQTRLVALEPGLVIGSHSAPLLPGRYLWHALLGMLIFVKSSSHKKWVTHQGQLNYSVTELFSSCPGILWPHPFSRCSLYCAYVPSPFPLLSAFLNTVQMNWSKVNSKSYWVRVKQMVSTGEAQ